MKGTEIDKDRGQSDRETGKERDGGKKRKRKMREKKRMREIKRDRGRESETDN